jgi:hypothetical protein
MEKNLFRRAALMGAIALAGCGGAEGPELASAPPAELSAVVEQPQAAGAEEGRKRRLNAAGFSAAQAEQLFALAESQYAVYFPGPQSTRALEGWAYRHYPGTGAYLAVIGTGVYVFGGPFGPQVRMVGVVSDFVSTPAVGVGRPLTARILAECPDANGSQSVDFYKCMVGYLEGTQKFDRTKSCRLEVAESGTLTLRSGGVQVSVARPYDMVVYQKIPLARYFAVNVRDKARQSIELGTSTLSFTEGGLVQAEGFPEIGEGATVSCTLSVPR